MRPHMAFASFLGIKPLLVATAAMESGTGLALVALPSPVATFLLGSSLDAPVSATVGRVAGVALVALGLACWLGRRDAESRATRGLVGAMFFYNAGVALVLAHGGTALGLTGIALWPTAALHAMMSGWCVAVWRRP
jgi:hypothetical protein